MKSVEQREHVATKSNKKLFDSIVESENRNINIFEDKVFANKLNFLNKSIEVNKINNSK